ncbi:hemolysin [Endozoicomonas sp. (ex Bugula neritina AB1)]|nr:hemolysin [Endozoicomonas sp. (ex Bugula neritina AB1)]
MKRIDRLMVDQGVVSSRTHAQRLISESRVKVLDSGICEVPTKPSHKFSEEVEIQIELNETDRYVSRGGLKLAGALEKTGLDITGFTVLDVGQSTGGFTDCVLQAGAVKVVGIEVGHDQLVESLRKDERVVCFEGANARSLPADELLSYTPEQQGFDLVVMDVSFISQTKILPALVPLMKQSGSLVSLVKPQFEVGSSGLGKGGIVRDESLYPQVKKRITECCESLKIDVQDYFISPIKGGDGNKEFFFWGVRSQ